MAKPRQRRRIAGLVRPWGAAVAGFLLLATPTVRAQDVAIGVTSVVTSIDPHFHNLSSNINVGLNVFDRLIDQDEQQRLRPALATSWKAVDDTTWEFTLRPGVVFHDGSPFGAEDVAASLRRVPWVPNSPGSFFVYTRAITKVVIVDEHRIRFETATPYPLLPVDLASINIVPRRLEQAPTAEFNAGRAAIGTGPYTFVEYLPGNRVLLRRNERYWGERPAWANATVRMIPNNATRVAALLAGDVQAIDNMPPSDAAQLRGNASVQVVSTRSNSVLFLHMDSFRE